MWLLRPLICMYLSYIQIVGVQVKVVFCVCRSGFDDFLNQFSALTGGELECHQRLVEVLASDQVCNRLELDRRHSNVFCSCFYFHCLTSNHFLSAAWPL